MLHSFVSHYQRVHPIHIPGSHYKVPWNHNKQIHEKSQQTNPSSENNPWKITTKKYIFQKITIAFWEISSASVPYLSQICHLASSLSKLPEDQSHEKSHEKPSFSYGDWAGCLSFLAHPASSRSLRTRLSKMSSHPICRRARMPPRISEVFETRASLLCRHFLRIGKPEENGGWMGFNEMIFLWEWLT